MKSAHLPTVVIFALWFGVHFLPGAAESFSEEKNRFLQLLVEQGFLDTAYEYSHARLKEVKLTDEDRDLVRLRLGNICVTLAAQAPNQEEQKRMLEEADGLLKELQSRADAIAQQPEAAIEFVRLLVSRGGMAVGQWQSSGREDDRSNSESFCEKALQGLESLIKQLETRAEKIEREVEVSELKANREYGMLEAWISESHYRKAWASYYLAACTPDTDRKRQLLDQAQQFFEEFTASYRNSVVVINCFIGLAKCHETLGDTEKALKLLEPIGPGQAPLFLLLQSTALRAEWLTKLGRFAEVIDLVDRTFKSLPERKALDAPELALLLKQAEAHFLLWKEEHRPVNHEKGTEICQRVASHGESWRNRTLALLARFPAGEATKAERGPLEAWVEAERLYAAKDYAQAEANYAMVIQRQEELNDGTLVAAARFRRAACQYLAGRPRQAAESFREFLKLHADDKLATRASFLLAQCHYSVFRNSRRPEEGQPCLEAFEQFLKGYPESTDRDEAMLSYVDALSLAGKFEQAQELLRKMMESPENKQNATAVSFLCRQREIEAAHAQNPAKAKEDAKRLAEEMRDFARSAPANWAAQIQLQLAEFLLGPILEDPDAAIQALDPFDKEDLSQEPAVAYELIRLRLEGFVQTRQWKPAQAELGKLLKLPLDERAVASILLKAGKGMAEAGREAFLKKEEEAGRRYLLWAAAAYETLLRSLESDRVSADRAVEARRVLVELYLECRDAKRARSHLDLLAQQSPESWFVLRSAALLEEQQEQHGEALQKWRRIEEGLEPTKEAWFEARYHIILNTLRLGDKEKASKILKLTRILYPELGGPPWKKKFAAMENDWLK